MKPEIRKHRQYWVLSYRNEWEPMRLRYATWRNAVNSLVILYKLNTIVR
jgi:hypothetical protein